LWLDGEKAHHLIRVLRVRVGDSVVLFDGHGGEYPAVVEETGRQRVRLLPGLHSPRDVESPLRIRLIQGISRGERMDFVVQKATELGVQRISPVHTACSVVRLTGERAVKRSAHWERIVQGACEQCGRNILPPVDAAADLDSVLGESSVGSRLLLHTGAAESIGSLPLADRELALLVGPEGGFTEAEIGLASRSGFVPVSLGPRILRTETAALAVIAILQSRFGDLLQPA
ncbi:MAG TPA: 16S rRNA (uracil(1498)-N(3))-methyltransferase, partial [Vicinamibacterales bacterium]|nr:16S rRNA (uracil(1498)-N(3))-methyltransferase [Vicinamibacterales bacterium]